MWHSQVSQWMFYKVGTYSYIYPLVMIVSYETLRTLTAYLANCEIGLLLCDEGHRLKNSGKSSLSLATWIDSYTSLRRLADVPGFTRVKRFSACHFDRNTYTGALLPWSKRYCSLILLQNDLSEYFSLLNFANPNFLGTKNDFRKNFENVIIRGRDSLASDAVKSQSEKKLKELGGLVTKFIIRRTNDLLSKYRA